MAPARHDAEPKARRASATIRGRAVRLAVVIVGVVAVAAGPSAAPLPTPTPAPTITSTPAPAVAGPYGSVQGDSRNNHQVGDWANASLSYRFRATTSSAATALRVQQRGGTAYSGGNGGTIQVTIQTDANGVPSGTVLAALVFNPGNPSGNWEVWTSLTFPAPATLTAGQLYHVVFDNVSADPIANFISLNVLFYWGAENPRQPTYSNDFAVLYDETNGWQLRSTETPIMDLAYANGQHDGMGYIGAMGQYYGSISGASAMVREHFTVSGSNRAVTSASVKVKRISGTSPLTISLMQGSTVLASGTVAASAVPLGNLPASDGNASILGGNTWATVTFPTVTLMSGTTYDLVLSTAAGTQYVAVPVQEGTDKGLRSYRFTDGSGQRTTNGGSSWSSLYLYGDVDLQFVLR